jgi:hypothetical protein
VIKSIADDLRTELAAKGCPLRVIYGPEPRPVTSLVDSRIVLERDREGGDVIGPPRSQHKNPAIKGVRGMGCVLRIFAKSSLSGANLWDHESLADQTLDKVWVALEKLVKLRRTLWTITGAKLLNSTELEMRGLETWPGVVFELRFAVDRGVFDTTWVGDAKPEKAFGEGADAIQIASTTSVTVNGAGSPEVACGAEET